MRDWSGWLYNHPFFGFCLGWLTGLAVCTLVVVSLMTP